MNDQKRSPGSKADEHEDSTNDVEQPTMVGIPLWGSVKTRFLRHQSERELGPTEEFDVGDWVGFTVTYYEGADRGFEPSYIVVASPFCDLDTVYQACVEIADACLGENEYAYFERDSDLRKAPSPKAEWHDWKT